MGKEVTAGEVMPGDHVFIDAGHSEVSGFVTRVRPEGNMVSLVLGGELVIVTVRDSMPCDVAGDKRGVFTTVQEEDLGKVSHSNVLVDMNLNQWQYIPLVDHWACRFRDDGKVFFNEKPLFGPWVIAKGRED